MTIKNCQNKDLSTQVETKSNRQLDASTYDYAYLLCSIRRSHYDASANKNYRPSVTLYSNNDLTDSKYQLTSNKDMVDIFSLNDIKIGMVIESYNNFYSVVGFEKKDSTYKKNRLLRFKKLLQKFIYTTI